MLLEIDPPEKNESRTKRRTRILLLETAYMLFSQHGLFLTSVVGIAKAARVTRRTFYNYYKTKEEVCSELHPLILNTLIANVKERWDEIKTSDSDLRTYFNVLFSYIAEDSTLLKYLVKFDKYSNSHSDVIDAQFQIDTYFETKSEIKPIISMLQQQGHIIEEFNDLDVLTRLTIQSFLAFITRFIYRSDSYMQEGRDTFDKFDSYLNVILHCTEGKIYA